MKNRRGSAWSFWIIIAVVLVFLFYYNPIDWSSIKSSLSDYQTVTTFSSLYSDTFFKPFSSFCDIVLGGIPSSIVTLSGATSAAIIVICIWVMLVLMFGDIIRNLSFFSEKVSWVVAVLMGVIGANLKFISFFSVFFSSIFISFGVLATYAGLVASFVAFIAIEWGISSLAPWVMQRKSLQEAVKARHTTGTIIEAIRHYYDVGQAVQHPENL